MTDEVESQESSEQTEDTSVPEESAPQTESSEAESQQAAPEAKQEEKPAPFHEHPRFKELIDQNRTFKENSEKQSQAFEAMQRELQSLRQQNTPKPVKPIDPFLADLEKVNPEYAKSMRAVMEQAEMAKAVSEELKQMKQQQFAEKAYNHFYSLLDTNKISDPLDRELYQNVVEAEVYRREQRGEKLGLKDLDSIFNSFKDKYSKAMEERDRKLTAKYVSDKKSDVTPKGATGGAASTPGAKKLASKDIAGQAKWLADQIRAQRKI